MISEAQAEDRDIELVEGVGDPTAVWEIRIQD